MNCCSPHKCIAEQQTDPQQTHSRDKGGSCSELVLLLLLLGVCEAVIGSADGACRLELPDHQPNERLPQPSAPPIASHRAGSVALNQGTEKRR